jgi:hypothetical protein
LSCSQDAYELHIHGHREAARGLGQNFPRGTLWRHNCKTKETVFYNISHFIAFIFQLGFIFLVKQSLFNKCQRLSLLCGPLLSWGPEEKWPRPLSRSLRTSFQKVEVSSTFFAVRIFYWVTRLHNYRGVTRGNIACNLQCKVIVL